MYEVIEKEVLNEEANIINEDTSELCHVLS